MDLADNFKLVQILEEAKDLGAFSNLHMTVSFLFNLPEYMPP